MASADKFHRSILLIANVILLILVTVAVLFIGSSHIVKPKSKTVASINPTSSITQACSKNLNYDCFKTEFTKAIKVDGIKSTLTALASLNDSSQVVREYCHSLAHVLGRTAYDMTQGNIGTIFTQGNTTCWSGFFHGALEKAFSQSKDLAKTASSICTEAHGVKGSFLTYQCLHGLGHGLSARFDNEIFSALRVCDSLATSYEQNSCYGGVFMENYVADGINHKTRYTDANDPLAPCDKVIDKYKFNCYQLVSIQILKLNSYNFGQAFETCTRSDSDYIQTCYQSVGRDISGSTAENYDQALADCALGNSDAEKICVMAVSTDSVYSRSSPANAKIICSKTKEELKEACYQAAGSSIQVLYDDQKQRIQACNLYEERFRNVCKTSANVT